MILGDKSLSAVAISSYHCLSRSEDGTKINIVLPSEMLLRIAQRLVKVLPLPVACSKNPTMVIIHPVVEGLQFDVFLGSRALFASADHFDVISISVEISSTNFCQSQSWLNSDTVFEILGKRCRTMPGASFDQIRSNNSKSSLTLLASDSFSQEVKTEIDSILPLSLNPL